MSEEVTKRREPVDECIIDYWISGNGPALLLLHGFPETKWAWHKIIPELIPHFTIIAPDLPGYGDSAAAGKSSKRDWAIILVKLMNQLGFRQFAVAGHDRGGRVAYRMALDHPDTVTQLAILEIIPTIDMIEQLSYERALRFENWLFLAQPYPFPETMIAHDPSYYLNYLIQNWSEKPELFSQEAKDEYIRCLKNPEVVKSICEEYRANVIDAAYDGEDRISKKQIHCPVLFLYSHHGTPASFGDPVKTWEKWASDIKSAALSCGHFLMEEAPEEVIEQFLNFFEIKSVPADHQTIAPALKPGNK